jgi:hypothetical protein
MSRPLRVEYPGAIYHVMCRGNARQRIFRDEADYQRLVDGLVMTVSRFGWEVFSFVRRTAATLRAGSRHHPRIPFAMPLSDGCWEARSLSTKSGRRLAKPGTRTRYPRPAGLQPLIWSGFNQLLRTERI